MRIDAELKDGKPYFGIFFGRHVCINCWTEPMVNMAIERLTSIDIEPNLEIRYPTTIKRPPWNDNFLCTSGTVSYKFCIWGRAHKVMKLLKKGIKRYKKAYVGGKRRTVRVDK